VGCRVEGWGFRVEGLGLKFEGLGAAAAWVNPDPKMSGGAPLGIGAQRRRPPTHLGVWGFRVEGLVFQGKGVEWRVYGVRVEGLVFLVEGVGLGV